MNPNSEGWKTPKQFSSVRNYCGPQVIAKRKDSLYEPGKRSGSWIKCRVNRGQEFVVGGYIPGPLDYRRSISSFRLLRLASVTLVARALNGSISPVAFYSAAMPHAFKKPTSSAVNHQRSRNMNRAISRT